MFEPSRLRQAAKHNDVDKLRMLVTKRPDCIDAKSGVNRFTALHVALLNGSEDAARALVEHGADVNLSDLVSTTPLHFAAWKCSAAMVEFLLEKGANPNIQQTSQKNSPLHFAAMEKKADVVSLLLSHGADPNLCNQDKMTPLHCAVHKQDVAVLECLLAASAEVNTENNPAIGYRFTPLIMAVYFERPDMVEMLLKGGAQPNLSRTNGDLATPLDEAVRQRNIPIVRLLLQYGAHSARHAEWIAKHL